MGSNPGLAIFFSFAFRDTNVWHNSKHFSLLKNDLIPQENEMKENEIVGAVFYLLVKEDSQYGPIWLNLGRIGSAN